MFAHFGEASCNVNILNGEISWRKREVLAKKWGLAKKNNYYGEKVKDTGEKEEKHYVFPVEIILCSVWLVQPAQHSSARPSVRSVQYKVPNGAAAGSSLPGQNVEQVFQVCFSRSTSGCVLWAQQ